MQQAILAEEMEELLPILPAAVGAEQGISLPVVQAAPHQPVQGEQGVRLRCQIQVEMVVFNVQVMVREVLAIFPPVAVAVPDPGATLLPGMGEMAHGVRLYSPTRQMPAPTVCLHFLLIPEQISNHCVPELP